MIIINKYLVPKGYAGITIFPFIIFKYEKYKTVYRLNHERIHLKQQLEMLVIPFYLWYGIEFLIRLVKYKDRKKAYKNISFEQESYNNKFDLDYFYKRRLYSWIKYLKK